MNSHWPPDRARVARFTETGIKREGFLPAPEEREACHADHMLDLLLAEIELFDLRQHLDGAFLRGTCRKLDDVDEIALIFFRQEAAGQLGKQPAHRDQDHRIDQQVARGLPGNFANTANVTVRDMGKKRLNRPVG